MVWNYLLQLGPVSVWRKVRSRLAEGQRNRKVAGIGAGRVVEASSGSGLGIGDPVVFFAPNHSLRWPRLSLDRRLVRPARTGTRASAAPDAREILAALRPLAGWSPDSGVPLDDATLGRALARLQSSGAVAEQGEGRVEAPTAPSHERLEARVGAAGTGRRTAVLFGLGHYAKTQVVPQVRRYLTLGAIHEIDPDQIAAASGLGAALDTSPQPRTDERYDAWFIAGYHHTHAALAVRALASGAYAVVEKPLVTTRDQFGELQRAMQGAAAPRLFACYHKRYSRLHEWARADLVAARGEPVDMHCIVYEIPLPALHWYNWPNAGSRLVSNGCHWLDYFLFVNDFSSVVDCGVQPLRGSDLLASVRLANGAQFAMSLTDTGSERLGVRELIELRAGHVTVRVRDASHYTAENSDRVLRRARVNPMAAYRRMYGSICRRITAGEDGDPVEWLRSTALMLDLEDALRTSARRR